MRHSKIVSFVMLLALSTWCKPSHSDCGIGFSAPAVNGGAFVLLGRDRSPLMLAFLALTAEDVHAPSRATAVILESLDHQYSGRGLQIAVMDATAVIAHRNSRHADIVNTAANWNLHFPVLEDPAGRGARCFHIRTLPTILLISPEGKELGRWEGFTRTPVLAQAIEKTLQGPLAALPPGSIRPENSSGTTPK
jgi:hypothetical protein